MAFLRLPPNGPESTSERPGGNDMNPFSIVLILASVGLSALAQVLLKHGSAAAHGATGSAYLAILASPLTWGGLLVYGASALLWLRVLSLVPLSQAYPFVALGFVLTTVAGIAVFGEPVVATRVAGTALILAGVVLVVWR